MAGGESDFEMQLAAAARRARRAARLGISAVPQIGPDRDGADRDGFDGEHARVQPQPPAAPHAVPPILPPIPGARPAAHARPRARHWGAAASFALMVLGPTAASVAYLYGWAADQYASAVAFSVRSGENIAPAGLLGALTQSVSTAGADAEIVHEYIRSQRMVEAMQAALPFEAIFNRPTDDFVFRLGEGRPVEEALEHWRWMTDVSFDGATALVRFEVRAFDPAEAEAVAAFVLAESTRVVNALSQQAQADAIGVAAAAVAQAEERLRGVRRAMRGFRDAEQDADPTAGARAAQALVATLEETLASRRVELDAQLALVGPRSPRVSVLRQQVASLEKQVAAERERLGAGDASVDGRRMADVLSDFEELTVDLEFAQNAYVTALSAYEQAQIEARRQSRFLAPHIAPTRSVAAQYPQRAMIALAVFALTLTVWSVALLIAYNVRDRR